MYFRLSKLYQIAQKSEQKSYRKIEKTLLKYCGPTVDAKSYLNKIHQPQQ